LLILEQVIEWCGFSGSAIDHQSDGQLPQFSLRSPSGISGIGFARRCNVRLCSDPTAVAVFQGSLAGFCGAVDSARTPKFQVCFVGVLTTDDTDDTDFRMHQAGLEMISTTSS
jgi:hypothetical protein